MAGLNTDGIPSTRIDSTTFSGTEFLVTNVSATTVNATTLSGVNVLVAGSVSDGQGRVTSIRSGSPSTYGMKIEVGSFIASDVSVSVAFGTPFATIPRVVLTPTQSGTLVTDTFVGSAITTGFNAWSQSGIAVNYIAIGT